MGLYWRRATSRKVNESARYFRTSDSDLFFSNQPIPLTNINNSSKRTENRANFCTSKVNKSCAVISYPGDIMLARHYRLCLAAFFEQACSFKMAGYWIFTQDSVLMPIRGVNQPCSQLKSYKLRKGLQIHQTKIFFGLPRIGPHQRGDKELKFLSEAIERFLGV